MAAAVKVLGVHTRKSFLTDAVREIALTTKIIDAVQPYFPKACVCISGYVNFNNQYWKVNYHWDFLTSKIDEFLAMGSMPGVTGTTLTDKWASLEKFKQCAQAIKTELLLRPPNPQTGYKGDPTMGVTKDSSSLEQITARHKSMKQSKEDFKSVLLKAGIVTAANKANPPAKEKYWWLAVAPVAAPGTSTHGSGYALDISGDNKETTRICKALGASLVFNESSHVHVEWKSGVTAPA